MPEEKDTPKEETEKKPVPEETSTTTQAQHAA